MSNLSAIINSDDLVISKQAGGFYSGGFNVSSILKEGNVKIVAASFDFSKESEDNFVKVNNQTYTLKIKTSEVCVAHLKAINNSNRLAHSLHHPCFTGNF